MKSRVNNELLDRLFKCILTMENVDECYRLFQDLCTVNELQAIAQRMEVARMLDENHTYIEIAEETRASTATISRVNRSLNYGADGYRLALLRVRALEEKERKAAQDKQN